MMRVLVIWGLVFYNFVMQLFAAKDRYVRHLCLQQQGKCYISAGNNKRNESTTAIEAQYLPQIKNKICQILL